VAAGEGGESPQVFGIGGEDLVAIVGEEDDGRVDDIRSARRAEEDAPSRNRS
jgi:hypothetical protein